LFYDLFCITGVYKTHAGPKYLASDKKKTASQQMIFILKLHGLSNNCLPLSSYKLPDPSEL
jgi:hypothetical protein